jgi:hypothetical protein
MKHFDTREETFVFGASDTPLVLVAEHYCLTSEVYVSRGR